MGLLWKLGGIALACAAAFLLVKMYGGSRENAGRLDERTKWERKVSVAEAGKLTAYQAGLDRQQAAETRYIETVRTLPPITNTVIERSTAYAATPAGAAVCLTPDRVLGINQTRSALFPVPAPAAPGGDPANLLPDAPGS